MILIFFTFLAAFALSTISAYFSVIGFASMFLGAYEAAVAMMTVLEFAKVVMISWTYRNWEDAPRVIKYPFVIAAIVLMLLTSMGIFGFLSKAHIDSTVNAGANFAEIKTINEQEKVIKERLDYLLARAKDPSTASNKLDKQIQDTQKELGEINQRKLPLLKEQNKLIADVGPIKYVAQAFFGDGEDALDRAVRLVITLIVVVFDPLAVLLLIAGNMLIKKKKDPIKEEIKPKTFDIPKFDEVKVQENTVEVPKENIASISPGVNVSTYDYNEPFAFKEKDDKNEIKFIRKRAINNGNPRQN
jgi:hypothetical protein